MKKIFGRRLMIFMMVFSLAFGTVSAQTVAAAASQTSAAKKTGWETKNGKTYYYSNGKKVTNKLMKINNKWYYLGSDGARKTGWYTIYRSGKYYAYYFNSKGAWNNKRKVMNSTLIKKTDSIIKSQKISTGVKTTSQNKAALKKLFNYVAKKYGYARVTGFNPNQKNWQYTYAQQLMTTKKGSCYNFAAAFGVLAKRATGLPVRVCYGTSNAFNTSRWSAHAWVEIKIGSKWYTYDPNAERFSSLRKGKWYQQNRSSMEGKVYKTTKTVNIEL